MGPDGLFGAVGIAGSDGAVNLLVRAIGDHVLARLLQRDRPLLGQPGDNRLMQGGEYGIARNQRQHIVERDVGALERGGIAERLPVGIERACELQEIRPRRMFGRMAGESHLEHGSRLLEVAHAIGCGQQVPGRATQ